MYRSVKISRTALLAHKLRTLLALLGIIVGVSAVIIMVAIGRGAQKEVLRKIEEMGANLIVVNAGQLRPFGGRGGRSGNVTTLTVSDARALASEVRLVEATAPVQSRRLQVKYRELSTNTSVVGTTPDFETVRNFHARAGGFFGDADNRALRRVAVLGQTVVDNLFGDVEPIGEMIRIWRTPFRVIGVLEEKEVDPNGADQDDQILIPINTALRRVFNLAYISTIYVQATGGESIDAAIGETTGLLRDRHRLNRRSRPDDFTIQSQADVLRTQEEATSAFTMLIGSVAAISLLVGGIGILAIMLMVIRERKYEIGLRMAVGARRKDILTQFLIEASILGVGGGAIGVLTGVTGSKECLMRRMILPLILFVFVACQPGAAPLTDEDVTALRELGQSYVRGFSGSEAGGVAAVYAEGAVEMPPNLPARDGVDAIRSAYEAYFEAGAETVAFTMAAAEIDGFDGLAFDRGTWSWTGREGAGAELVTQTGKYLSIARRQEDGSWRYTAMIWNSDAPLE